jgi:hypothetical protein
VGGSPRPVAAVMVQQLGKVLPPQYTAGPQVHLGAQIEVDVGTFVSEPAAAAYGFHSQEVAAAAAVWTPPKPTLTVETDLADFDEYEVRVYDNHRGRRLGGRHRTGQPGQQGPAGTPQPVRVQVRRPVAAGRVVGAGGRGDGAKRQSVRRSIGFDRPVRSDAGRTSPCNLRRRMPLATARRKPMAGDLESERGARA